MWQTLSCNKFPVSSITARSSAGVNPRVVSMRGSAWMFGQECWHSHPPLSASPCSHRPRFPRSSSPGRRRQIRVVQLNPGIPERLFGSSTSLMLRLGEGRGWGKRLFSFFSLFPKWHKALTVLFVLWCCRWRALTDPPSVSQITSNCENGTDSFHIHALLWFNYLLFIILGKI